MKLIHGFKIVLVSVVVAVVCANVSTADMSALSSGGIAACDCLGRSAVPALEDSLLSEHRVIAAWLEVFSERGINSRYSQGYAIVAIEGLGLAGSVTAGLDMQICAESALELPDATRIHLAGRNDYQRLLGLNLCDRTSAITDICGRTSEGGLTAVDPTGWLASPWSRHENALEHLYGTAFGNAVHSGSY